MASRNRIPYKDAAAARFGENLHFFRKRLRLSQEELAFRAGLHRTEIGFLENGKRMARIDTLVKLAYSVEVPPGDLVRGLVWVPTHVDVDGHFLARRRGEEWGYGL
jgi:transcriptional regulator with XRE-family HTH domain